MTTLTREERRKRRKRIADFVRKGGTIRQAAAEFGVTNNTVRVACGEHGLKLPDQRGNVTPRMKGCTYMVIAALQNGRKQQVIADSFGLSPQRVSEIAKKCKRAGIRIPLKSKKGAA